MASKNKTSKLKLNLWESTDRPQRGDFNSDNLIIDEVLGVHLENTDLHLTSEEKGRVQRPVQVTGYVGDGQAEATISLGFSPVGVIVYCANMPRECYDSSAGCTKVYSAMTFYGAGATAGVELAGTSIRVKQDSTATSGFKNCLNESGRQYKVIAIR